MAKIRLTKNELKRQRETLERLNRYLPTLELKKQQLLQEIRKIQHTIDLLQSEIEQVDRQVFEWVDVFAEEIDLQSLFKVKEIRTVQGNVAGIDIPLFEDIEFEEVPYDFFVLPLWVDKALEVCKEQIMRKAKVQIAEKQQEILREELRITVQRINLFEKVKIPEAKENIRIIQILLGDLQTAEVGRGKIAKAKIAKRKERAAAA
ncbi:V-type ATP synthase subunit D [candidate division KSB1 bacterium]|nr:MAG: V-type ATP synthase subunit D [candidate division KSB1 bacterium]